MAWIQEVVEKYEEIIWVTYSRSGTGIGTLLYVLQEMQKGAREAQTLHNTPQFNIILRRKHETTHAIAYPQKDIMKEWLYLSEYEHSESLLFIEYSFTIKER